MQPKFGYKCKCKLFLDIFQGMRICYTLGFMTFVWHFLEACTGFIHYMFSLAYFPNFVWGNLAKNRTKEKSFTLSPMASKLKLLPVSFGVNMCETTLSHVQYVDDVWCMFSHFWSGITDEQTCNTELARTLTESDRSWSEPSKTIRKLFTCMLILRKTFDMLREQNWRWSQSPCILGVVCFWWTARYQTQLDTTSQMVSEAGKNLEPTVPVKGHCQMAACLATRCHWYRHKLGET